MKLSLVLGDNQHTVEWEKELADFPHVVEYDNKYWEWISWHKDPTEIVDEVLFFGETRESSLPVNMFGMPFPVPNLTEMFNFSVVVVPCECGAKFSSFPNHHMTKCPRWSAPK